MACSGADPADTADREDPGAGGASGGADERAAAAGEGGDEDSGGAGGVAAPDDEEGTAGAAGGPQEPTGAAGGGSGGTAPPDPEPREEQPVAIDGPGAFFPGTSAEIRKLASDDVNAGYVYAVSKDQPVEVKITDVNDAALPPGVKHAFRIDAPTRRSHNVILGFNLRADEPAGAFRWFDASGFAGLRFFARVGTQGAPISVAALDATNLGRNEQPASECASDTRQGCEPIHAARTIVRNAWTPIVLGFDEFKANDATQGMSLQKLGRFDIVYLSPNNNGIRLEITGVQLLTSAELERLD